MPCPYKSGRDTALPSPHSHVLAMIKSATGIDITYYSKIHLNSVYPPKFP